MAAVIYYKDKLAEVTGESINLHGKEYALKDVQGVRVWQDTPSRRREWPYLILTAGAIVLFAVINSRSVFPVDWLNIVPMVLTFDLLFGLAAAGVLLMQLFLKSERVYMLGLRGSFGNSSPICCQDESHAQMLADAIRMAIVNYGSVLGEQSGIPVTS